MFHLPTLQPCDGLPIWLSGADDLAEALVLWWPSGTAWVVHAPTTTTTPTNHVDAA